MNQPTQAKCVTINYSSGSSYKMLKISGNPRYTSPADMTLICDVNGASVTVNIKNDLRKALHIIKQSLPINFRFNERRLLEIKSKMPETITLENNMEYDICDEYSTRQRVSQKDIEEWAQRIITAF